VSIEDGDSGSFISSIWSWSDMRSSRASTLTFDATKSCCEFGTETYTALSFWSQAVGGPQDAENAAGLVAFATGWRTASEVLPLEWRNVDWSGRCVRLDPHTTKNGEARSFPFTADIEKILKAQLAEHELLKAIGTISPFVFQRKGERIGYFRATWRNACKAAGCPGALVHDMRRSAVRTFERAGVPRSVAMSIVGHKTESIYRRYAIVDEAMQREAAARLDAWTNGPTAPAAATVTSIRRGN
jgi:integrase